MNESRTYDSEFSESRLNKVALEIKKGCGAHNPKLNIYKLVLASKGDLAATFRNLFKEKFGQCEDDRLFDSYFQHITDAIGNKNFRKDNINKKVIGKTNDSPVIELDQHKKDYYVDGVIEGGKYGIERKVVDIKNNTHNIIINKESAVLDSYYLLIYTPLNSQTGFLLIQSYTEESVTNSIKNLVRDFFSNENSSYNIKTEPYLPQKFIKKYIESSTIGEFGVTIPTPLSPSLRNEEHSKEETFEVEIRIKPQSKMPSKELLDQNSEATIFFKNIIKKFVKHKNKTIKKEAFLTDNNGREALAYYDKNKQNRIDIAESTIYLEEEGIFCDYEETGSPDFNKIQEYCLNILKEIKQDFKHQTGSIHEF